MKRKINLNFLKGARFPAFTLTELLLGLVIAAIIGNAIIYSLVVIMQSFRQTDDHVTAAREMESVMVALKPQFTNIGLAMPNNSAQGGSFNISFTGPGNAQPVMARMGDIDRGVNRAWGGPVTLGQEGAHVPTGGLPLNPALIVRANNAHPDANNAYTGEELFYAWSVPTGVRLSRGDDWIRGNTPGWAFESRFSDSPAEGVLFRFLNPGDVQTLVDFNYDRRHIGISLDDRGRNPRSWIVFPSFKVPLLLEEINAGANTIRARVSPHSYNDHAGFGLEDVNLRGQLNGYEEVHLVQAACIYVDKANDRLIQRIYTGTGVGYTDRELATNILGTYFVFDDVRRLLTMYIVGRGNSRVDANVALSNELLASKLPAFIPAGFISNADRQYRILVESMTWRIKN